MKKKKDTDSFWLAALSIIAIVAIVFLVSRSFVEKDQFKADIAVSIDVEGNVYDGEGNYIGQMADPDIRFYDEAGNLLGRASLSIGNN